MTIEACTTVVNPLLLTDEEMRVKTNPKKTRPPARTAFKTIRTPYGYVYDGCVTREDLSRTRKHFRSLFDSQRQPEPSNSKTPLFKTASEPIDDIFGFGPGSSKGSSRKGLTNG